MSKKISTLSAGNLVKLNENGVAKKFIFLQYNHYGKSEVVLLRKDTFAVRAFKPSYNSYSNGYNGSDIDSFVNDQYPQRLDPIIRACLIDVPLPTARGAYYGSTVDSGVVNLMRRGFLLSHNEVFGTNGIAAEGSIFSYLNIQANRIAYYDETSTAVYWWLRSPRSDRDYAYIVNTSGASDYYDVYRAYNCCPRPALALSSEILVSDTANSDGCYTIESAPAGEEYQKVNGVWLRMV